MYNQSLNKKAFLLVAILCTTSSLLGFINSVSIHQKEFADRFTTPKSWDFKDGELCAHVESIKRALQILPAKRCTLCGKLPEKLLRCSACKKICYCSAECQRKDWPAHKINFKRS